MDLVRYQTQGGKVHLGTPSRLAGSAALYCTGRTVSFALPTSDEVSCKACLKKQNRPLTVDTEHTKLTWNPRKQRLEGTYRGVVLETNVVYQGDGQGDRMFGHSATPGIFTGTWSGTVDTDGEPLFRHVDEHHTLRTFRNATFFDRLENIS